MGTAIGDIVPRRKPAAVGYTAVLSATGHKFILGSEGGYVVVLSATGHKFILGSEGDY